jgi:hypothetical protein
MLALVAHVGEGTAKGANYSVFPSAAPRFRLAIEPPTTQLAQLSRGSESILLSSISSCVREEFEILIDFVTR